MSDLAAFYQARIVHCRKMADAAENGRVKDIHEELICFYRSRLAALAAVTSATSTPGQDVSPARPPPTCLASGSLHPKKAD